MGIQVYFERKDAEKAGFKVEINISFKPNYYCCDNPHHDEEYCNNCGDAGYMVSEAIIDGFNYHYWLEEKKCWCDALQTLGRE